MYPYKPVLERLRSHPSFGILVIVSTVHPLEIGILTLWDDTGVDETGISCQSNLKTYAIRVWRNYCSCLDTFHSVTPLEELRVVGGERV